MSGSGLIGVIGAFAITLGVLAAALVLIRRLQSGATWNRRGVPLQVLQRIAVGPKQGIALLRVADRVLVVSIADAGTTLLTELSGPPLTEMLASSTTPAPPSSPGFRLPGLGRIAVIAALMLAPALAPRPAGAQPVAAPATNPARVATPVVAGPDLKAFGIQGPAPPHVDIKLGEGKEALQLSGTVGLVVFLGFLTLLPAIFMLMTSFTRILIVLHFLRSALGTQSAPPSQLLVAIAVLLTGVVMNPVLQKTHAAAIEPYLGGRITQAQAYSLGVEPFREFMLANTRAQDLAMFAELSRATEVKSVEELPTVTVVSAFVTSELRTAFQMGFVIFLPFVVVDVIVASVLMSLGMFMLPPAMISLPFKLLLFVLADGWTLVFQNLVASFH